MALPIRFDGKVVLVTGAGNGLGRAYALEFAQRGAAVVVNDLGGGISGGGASVKAADKVVFEIKAKGGKAVANYDSVENGEKLVQTALDNFGRIDVVVNNAGILRDKSFARISDDDWDIIQRVHLRGSFLVTRAAWPHMRKQGFGRILMITSSSGIYGNFGQANYGAAKMGLVGLSRTLALEGRKHNIRCNAIAPMAGSRLTEAVMPADIVQALKPEYVAPVVAYLCHDSCEETGALFEVGAGWVGKLRWQRTEGVVLREANKPFTAETVRDKWDKITDFTNSTTPASNTESSAHMVTLVTEMDQRERGAPKQPQADTKDPVALAKAITCEDFTFTYDERDVILYALGIGASTRQKDYLKFLFELSEDFTVIPTYAVIPPFGCLTSMSFEGTGLKVDPTRMVHGEQYLEIFKPLQPSATLLSKLKSVDVVDKKSGAVIILNVDTFDETGEKVAFNQMVTFAIGAGNFGGPKTSNQLVPLMDAPKRTPDATMTEKTDVDQAALYRLSGDRNPLHINPTFASMGGFKSPILHGLSTFGFAVRHVMTKFANNDMTRFKSVKVRFVKPVLPGQTLQTDMWKDGNRIFFQTKTVENNTVCISGAYVDLHEAKNQPSPAEEQKSGSLKCNAVFETMSSKVENTPGLAAKINAVFQWNVTQDGAVAATWTMDMKNGKGKVYTGEPHSGKADCTITIGDEDFMGLVSGKLNAQSAFMSGKLKLAGNIMLAQKLGNLFATVSKM